jgi:hypothetical protein
MIRCPRCSARFGFWRSFRMVTHSLTTVRCRECAQISEPTLASRLLVVALIIICFAATAVIVTREEFLGITRWHPQFRTVWALTFVGIFVAGSAIILFVARLAGPVAEPRCPTCGCDWTELRVVRCPECKTVPPWGLSKLIDRPEVWLFAFVVLGMGVYFLIWLQPLPRPETLVAKARERCTACGLSPDETDEMIDEVASTYTTRNQIREDWEDSRAPQDAGFDETCRTCLDAVIEAGFRQRRKPFP